MNYLTRVAGGMMCLSLLWTLVGCGGADASAPVITMTVDTPRIACGESATLAWTVKHAAIVDSTEHFATTPTGQRAVFPTKTTTYTLTARGAKGEKAASVTVVVDPIILAVAPNTATVRTGQTMPFTAHVRGTADTRVRWSLMDQDPGAINAMTGAYTAPDTPGLCRVVATSLADGETYATAVVYVNTSTAVSIAPPYVELTAGQQYTLTGAIVGNETGGVWSASDGSIAANGTYTAPLTPGTYTVKLVSLADATASATATVVVKPGSSGTIEIR